MVLRVCREDERDEKLEEQRLHHENSEAGYKSKRQGKEAASKSWRGKTRTLGQNTTSKDAVDMITFRNAKLIPQRCLLLKTAVDIQLWNSRLRSDTGIPIFMG